jgi:ADP-ribose pyrophosphatase YjhB (NUDIX family)
MQIGANCVVRNDAGDILLIKREDFRFWTIPGGSAEAGESPAETAARETREESGVQAAIDDLIGVYTTRRATNLIFLYTGHPTGGTPCPTDESVESRYFAPEALPHWMLGFHRQRLFDALSSERGLFRYQVVALVPRLLLPPLLRVRKLRNRLQGRPELPIAQRRVIAQGFWNGSPAVEVAAQPGQPVWETLRRRAEQAAETPVQIIHLIGIDGGDDPLVLRFALRALNGKERPV